MSIKFFCDRCDKKLKVADSSAGKRAKCPKCGNLTRIPDKDQMQPAGAGAKGETGAERITPSIFEDESVDLALNENIKKKPSKPSAPKPSIATAASIGNLPTAMPVAEFTDPATSQPNSGSSLTTPNPYVNANHSASGSNSATAGFSDVEKSPLPVAESPYESFESPSSSPYAAPLSGSNSTGATNSSHAGILQRAFGPLHNNIFFLKAAGWALIASGAIACLTIVGIIVGWLPIWMGICLRNSALALESGIRSGRIHDYEASTKNMSTYFTILGILSLINLVMIALYALALIVMLIVGITAGLS